MVVGGGLSVCLNIPRPAVSLTQVASVYSIFTLIAQKCSYEIIDPNM